MKKLDKIQNQLDKINSQLDAVSFELKDTSYRRAGGYYGTDKADISNVLVLSSFARTKHLNTYICVSKDYIQLVDERNRFNLLKSNELIRLRKIADKKWANDSIEITKNFINEQIEKGLVNTNYAKILIIGNNHIYLAHPYYQHRDYNKSIAMPNTNKHQEIAIKLNKLMFENNPKLQELSEEKYNY